MCLNLLDLSDVVNITCIVHYGIEINIHTYIHNLHTFKVKLYTPVFDFSFQFRYSLTQSLNFDLEWISFILCINAFKKLVALK